jgi:hypothetical protein
VAELCGVGVESVGGCIERAKAEDAVFGCAGADFGAGGLVAQDECDTDERGRMQIGKATGERTGLRRLNFYGVLRRRLGGTRLSRT